MERAHVYRKGEIGFLAAHRRLPKGALPLPDVPRALIEARARRAYDGKTLLVPGVPEARTARARSMRCSPSAHFCKRTGRPDARRTPRPLAPSAARP